MRVPEALDRQLKGMATRVRKLGWTAHIDYSNVDGGIVGRLESVKRGEVVHLFFVCSPMRGGKPTLRWADARQHRPTFNTTQKFRTLSDALSYMDPDQSSNNNERIGIMPAKTTTTTTRKVAAKKVAPVAKKVTTTKAPAKTATKAPAKKVTAKKVAAPVEPVGGSERLEEIRKANRQLAAQIVQRREAGETMSAIAEDLGISQTKAGLLYLNATTDTVGGEATTAKVVKDRDEGHMSWPQIGAKYGIGKSKVQSLYRESGKDPHESVVPGFGGRYGDTYSDNATKVRGTTNGTATKATKATKASKTVGDGTGPVFGDGDKGADIVNAVTGKKITVKLESGRNGKAITVASNAKVGILRGVRLLRFSDEKGNTRSVQLDSIVKVA